MDDLALATPLWLAALTVVVNALVGALHGLLDDDRHWDVVGIATFALLMGLGGGVARDLLVGIPPQSLRSPWPLTFVLGGAVLAVVLAPWARRAPRLVGALDALALSLFAITGAATASVHGLPVLSSVLVGVVSAVGGGVLVSVVRGEVPTVLQPSRPLALLAAVVAVVYLALATWQPNAAFIVAAVLGVALYLLAESREVSTRPIRVRSA